MEGLLWGLPAPREDRTSLLEKEVGVRFATSNIRRGYTVPRSKQVRSRCNPTQDLTALRCQAFSDAETAPECAYYSKIL